MNQNTASTTGRNISTTNPGLFLFVLGTCLWFGILAGLAERLLYHYLPRTIGGNDLWYDALADLLAFTGLAVPLIIAGIFNCRRYLSKVAFFLCSALFTLDCLFVIWPPFGHRLAQMALLSGGALTVAVLATGLFLRFTPRLMAFGRLTLPVLILYALFYVGGSAWWGNHEENVQTAALHSRSGSPNVLLIIMDAVGAKHLSTYGYDRKTSPYLSEFASRGVLFEKAIAPSSWTLPSHASMFNGRLPTEHHAGEYDWRLDGRFPSLAAAFQKNGYRTAAFSANTLVFTRRMGLSRGYMHFEDGSILERLLQTTLGERIQTRLARGQIIDNLAGRQDAREISQNALRWMRHGSQPFFVTVNYFDAHEPLHPPLAYFHRFSTRPSPLPGQYNWPDDVQLPPGDLKAELDAYDASIAYIDAQISAFMKQLQAAGLLKNTIVIITSDHGQEFQEHGFMFHEKGLYWELVHAPLVISWPGHIPADQRVGTPVALQSLPATLMTMVGAASDPFPGPSLTPLWSTDMAPASWPAPVSELAQMGSSPRFPSYYGALTSVVTPQWHYLQGGKFGQELYPCCGDEQRNLAGTTWGASISSAFRQVLQKPGSVTSEALQSALRQRVLQAAMQQPGQTTPSTARQKISNSQRMDDQLHALGYVH